MQHPDRPGVCQPLGTGAGTRLARGRAEAPEPRRGAHLHPRRRTQQGLLSGGRSHRQPMGRRTTQKTHSPTPGRWGRRGPFPRAEPSAARPEAGPEAGCPSAAAQVPTEGHGAIHAGGGCRPLPTACWAHTGPSASGSALGPRRLSKRIKGRRRPLSAAGQSLPGTWDTPQRQGVLSAPLPRRGPCCLSPGHVVCEGAPRQRSEGRPGPSPAARPPPPAGLAPAHAPAPSPARGLRRGAAVPAPP